LVSLFRFQIQKVINIKTIVDIFEPLLTPDVKQTLENNRQLFLYLKNRLIKNLLAKASLLHLNEIHINDQIVLCSGDVIYRPLENIESDWNLDFNHYGIVFGTSNKGEKLILDIASKKNVSMVPFETFLGKHSIKKIGFERKPKDTTFETILKRAEELQFEMYSVTNLNCRHFVNYCVYGKKESEAVQNISNIIAPLLDMVTAYLDLKADFQTIQKDKDLIINLNTKIKQVNINIRDLK
jgi:hypothetical protein